ncbi:DUF4192 domain-containing protein [Nocardiopsis gilva YIM 90087]|uniref:DUF4192 domain-containing protein n=1 Tax=Nocardiopsis gilva YIM 90087 TaxID=1235441 RepID=A0A223S9Y0_9ACTN|nr:DUF4192 domain-containing protein [Nocardiopsis gilva]ASU84856.1 DUF4192 domain-containing protein [Nocardiopsis gilva YIM 90087]
MATDDSPHVPVPEQTTLTIGGPTDVIAAVPYLLGFHPADSIVILGIRSGATQVRCLLRCDLADELTAYAAEWADQVAAMLAEADCGSVVAVGYGPARHVTPCVDALRASTPAVGIPVREALRVADGRYWSYVCDSTECCPHDGVAYDVATSAVPATAVVGGLTVWRDRGVIEEFVAAVNGHRRVQMERATVDAERRAERMRQRLLPFGEAALRTTVRCEGVRVVRAAVDAALRGDLIDAPERIAWLGLLLGSIRVRDEAWARIDAAHLDVHVGLWRQVFRHVRTDYSAAPGSLLAFAAWQSGDIALADVVLDRVEEAAPHYTMAALVRRAVRSGMPPEKWEPMTPEWLEEVAPLTGSAVASPAAVPMDPERPIGPGGSGEGA